MSIKKAGVGCCGIEWGIEAHESWCPSLDAAWAEVEAALPEGWAIGTLTRNSARGRTKDQAWWCSANGSPAIVGARSDRRHPWPPGHRKVAYGPTPAAALRALAAKLREVGR
jgi:hypothetical protein